METIEIIGYKRANLGKQNSKKLREEGNVPCVVYGGKEQIHFHSPMILFRDLVYTPGANFVKLYIEGIEKDAILQDIQFHPVSETILHDNNYKDQILRYFQHNYQLYPTYKSEKNEGNNKYECKLYKGDEYIVSGYGNSKKKSEQDASKRALIKYHVLSE